MSSDRKSLGLMDIFVNPMKVTIKQFFKSTFGKPTTVMYPLEKRDPPPTYRGMNAVIWDLCIGCGICGEVCPNKCLKMKPVDLSDEEKDKSWYGSHVSKKKSKAERPAINFGHCMFCGFCEDYCPTGAMTMTDFYELADTTREGLIYPARSMKVDLDETPTLPLTNYMMESPALDSEPCIGCKKCVDHCPTNCIVMDEGVVNKKLKSGKVRNIENPFFDYTICIGCSTCVKVCPASCLHMEPISNSSSSGLTLPTTESEA
tara:strand:+ start:216 stop:995 length:780 start_codon:yes stop_codon:yes gene_type:complete